MAKPKDILIYVTDPSDITDIAGIASSLEELDDEVHFEGGEAVGIYKLVAIKIVNKGVSLT
jgi:uncharacterized linocin/CFP29 family protein